MDCERFIYLSRTHKKAVCLFGAGECGRTWGFMLLKCAGFQIAYYVDNYLAGSTCNGLQVETPDILLNDKSTLCFVTVMGIPGSEIIRQLETIGVENIFWLHDGDDVLVQFPQYLDELGDEDLINKYSYFMDDKTYLARRFKERTGIELDIDNPRTFNEKIQWLKLYDRKPIYTKMVDKYEVKRFISEKIGEEYIIPTIGIYNSIDEIDFSKLPEKFVIKCTHDSGSVFICKNRKDFDIEKVCKEINTALKKNYYWPDREWPYYDVPRRIIVEEYLEESSGRDINDYKVFTFNGKPELIQVDFDRFNEHKRNLYTTDWNYINASIEFPNDKNTIIEKPICLEKMLEFSSILAKGTMHLRCDFYVVDNRLYVGELTFHHGSGCETFVPNELNYKLGSMINLISV